jgi:fumarylacetoacetate (FAA) hydrolase
MKLVTFRTGVQGNGQTRAGLLLNETVLALNYSTVLELLRDPHGLESARTALEQGEIERGTAYRLTDVTLLAPIPEPPTMRDFYAFEQHVKTARAQRGLDMIPAWYEVPIFYFTNTSEIYGPESAVPYPVGSHELDFELEVACVIGREGKDIPAEEASSYIAGYMIMNDWSARDFQSRDMQLNLGPGKGKDFATSLGPWLVTPDGLSARRVGSGAEERYNLTMLARVNGREVSRGNLKDIYHSFPQIVAWASRNVRLRVGDVLGSGTVGTGCILELGTEKQPWLQRNDVIELEIEGLGVLRNTIV